MFRVTCVYLVDEQHSFHPCRPNAKFPLCLNNKLNQATTQHAFHTPQSSVNLIILKLLRFSSPDSVCLSDVAVNQRSCHIVHLSVSLTFLFCDLESGHIQKSPSKFTNFLCVYYNRRARSLSHNCDVKFFVCFICSENATC